MKSKPCGECCYFTKTKNFDMCAMYADFREEHDCRLCEYFVQKVTTNGDKIIAGGMRSVAVFAWKQRGFGTQCDNCAYATKTECKRPADKTCIDGIEAWLNAPAESEVEDE